MHWTSDVVTDKLFGEKDMTAWRLKITRNIPLTMPKSDRPNHNLIVNLADLKQLHQEERFSAHGLIMRFREQFSEL